MVADAAFDDVLRSSDIRLIELLVLVIAYADDSCCMYQLAFEAFDSRKERFQRFRLRDISMEVFDPTREKRVLARQQQSTDEAVLGG